MRTVINTIANVTTSGIVRIRSARSWQALMTHARTLPASIALYAAPAPQQWTMPTAISRLPANKSRQAPGPCPAAATLSRCSRRAMSRCRRPRVSSCLARS